MVILNDVLHTAGSVMHTTLYSGDMQLHSQTHYSIHDSANTARAMAIPVA